MRARAVRQGGVRVDIGGDEGHEVDGTAEVRELAITGDWAWARTHISISVTMPDGKEMRRSGYTLTILTKDMDGRWLIARDANLLRAEPPTS